MMILSMNMHIAAELKYKAIVFTIILCLSIFK